MKKRSLYLILSRKVTSKKGGAVTPFYSGVTAPPLDVSL